MDPEEVFALISTLLILSTTAVLIFRPITNKLGSLLEAMALSKMKNANRTDDDVSALLLAIDDVQQRLRHIDSQLSALPPGVRAQHHLPSPDSHRADELSSIAARIRGPHSDGHA